VTAPDVPRELEEALRDQRGVLFVGAGLSRLAGGPSWEELLNGLIDVAQAESLALSDSYDAARRLAGGAVEERYALAQHLSERLGNRLVDRYLDARLTPLEPTAAHAGLTSLNWAGYVTTNYDTLIEDAHEVAHGERPRVITWRDVDELARLDEFDVWVVKLHGCVTRADTVVLAEEDLDAVLRSESTAQRLVGTFDRLTTLFVGYGLGDPDVLRELRRLAAAFASSSRQHFSLTAAGFSAIWSERLQARYRVRALAYDVTDHDHGPGLEAWAAALAAASRVASPASRRKLLFCVKALAGEAVGVPEVRLLVTDRVRRWGVERSAPRDTDRLDKAYLLPPADDYGQDRDEIAATFSELAGFRPSDVAVGDLHEFSSTKPNPALDGRPTEYRFRLVPVSVGNHEDWFAAEEVQFGTRACVWLSFDALHAHDPTRELNGDVLDEMSGRYGRNLRGLAFAMTGEVLAARDPYAQRAERYGQLGWVQDRTVARTLLSRADAGSSGGVVDLGCGPAAAAAVVVEELGIEYVGIDRSPGMACAAEDVVTALAGAHVRLHDFRQPPDTPYDGWTALLKNVLHLVPDPLGLLQEQLARWGRFRCVALAETVAPSVAAKVWVQRLFATLGARHKQHFFSAVEMRELLEASGLTVTWEDRVEQHIDVEAWIDSFDPGPELARAALEQVAGAPPAVRRDLDIHEDGGRLRMLRLQYLATATS
jgi:SAM-dependent methyltransferase